MDLWKANLRFTLQKGVSVRCGFLYGIERRDTGFDLSLHSGPIKTVLSTSFGTSTLAESRIRRARVAGGRGRHAMILSDRSGLTRIANPRSPYHVEASLEGLRETAKRPSGAPMQARFNACTSV